MLGEHHDLPNVLRDVGDRAMHCGECRHRLASDRDDREQVFRAELRESD